MDVRCEKCMTVYELDDARVGDAGLTVKCQECGNLFKVRRRSNTAELVAVNVGAINAVVNAGLLAAVTSGVVPDSDSDVELRSQPLAVPSVTTEETTAASMRARTDARPDARAEQRSDGGGWMLRSAKTGDVQRFRELTTLQQWIVERKVSRADEISRGGESWKALGGIAELASFFHVVEQAESVARAAQAGLTVRRAHQTGGLDSEQIGALSTELIPQLPPASDDDDDDGTTTSEATAQRGFRGGLVALVVASALGIGGFTWWRHHRAVPTDDAAITGDVDKGRASIALDTDDGYRQAIALLDRVVEESDARVVSGGALLEARVELSEAHVLWATDLAEDAHQIEQAGMPGASAARTMRAEAKSHLERARHILEEPTGPEAIASARLALAFADLGRAEGAPFDAVDRYLARARAGVVGDPMLAAIEGELALRDGKAAEAQAHFSEATRVAHDGSEWLARAHFRLAQLAATEARASDLHHECDELLRLSPTHERGHALCAAPAADMSEAAAVATPDLGLVAKAAAPAVPTDYKALVHEADHLAETNRSPQARKLYERALELDPKGVSALVGLGYCDLDAEHFMNAVDRFDAALAVDASSGDAMLGLAESYKVRGRSAQAIEFYKKYLAAHPSGEKVPMAQKNLRELETKSVGESTPVNDRVTVKPRPSDGDKSDDDKPDTVLPRPPMDEPPP